MSWGTFPVVECPHCGQEFQVDDYYNLDTGDSFDCSKCEKEIHIWQMETVVEVDLRTKPEQAEG